MAINPKEKAALEKQWAGSKPAAQGRLSSVEWPDMEAQFEVTTWEPEAAKARIKVGYTLIAGNDAFVGQEHLQYENLTGSDQSMGFFKARLLAFGISEDEIEALGIEEVLGDELKEKALGKKFVGLAKNKNDYLNVYANRPVDSDGEETSSESTETEETETTETEEGGVKAGDKVSFTSKQDGDLEGEVIEIEDGMARVRANKKVYKLPIDRLTAIEAEQTEETETEETEETETEETETEEPAAASNGNGRKHGAKLPAPKAIQAMKAPELKAVYSKLGIKFESVKQPREFLVGVAGLVQDKKYMPAISQLPALVAGLKVKTAKGAKPAVVVAELRKVALAKFS